jgi:hypothetical protein
LAETDALLPSVQIIDQRVRVLASHGVVRLDCGAIDLGLEGEQR